MATRIAPLVPQRRSGRRCGTVSDSCGPHSPRPPASRRWSTQLAGRMNDGPRRRWPPLRWLGKLRPDPLRRLGIGQSSGQPELLRRTSLPSSSPRRVRRRTLRCVRSPTPHRRGCRRRAPQAPEAAKSRAADVPDALDRVVGGADLGMDRAPRWWRLVAAIQWVLLGAALVGACGSGSSLCWPTFRSTSTHLSGRSRPTVLLVGGLAAGLLLRVVIRPWVAIGAARRRRRVTSELLRRVETVAEDFVLAPLAGRADCLHAAVRGGPCAHPVTLDSSGPSVDRIDAAEVIRAMPYVHYPSSGGSLWRAVETSDTPLRWRDRRCVQGHGRRPLDIVYVPGFVSHLDLLDDVPSTATRSTTWLVSRVSSPSTSAAPDFPTDRSDSAASPTEWMTSGRSWTQQASSAPRSSASQRVVPSRSFSRRRIRPRDKALPLRHVRSRCL